MWDRSSSGMVHASVGIGGTHGIWIGANDQGSIGGSADFEVDKTSEMRMGYPDHGEKRHFRDHHPPSEADGRKLPSSGQLVGESPGHAEQLTGLGHRDDEPVSGQQCRHAGRR